jgi:hypothetical protein
VAVITLQKTTVGRNLWRDSARGANNTLVRFFAVGTGGSTPGAANTRLDAEVYRRSATSYTNGTTGELLVDVYISPSDLVGVNIAEIGIYGGTSATSSVNSGILLARGLYAHPGKLSTESIILRLDLTFS